MKTPKFTPEQIEYLTALLNGQLKDEIYAREHADKIDKSQFRAGQRDGFSMALRAIHVDQQQAGHSA